MSTWDEARWLADNEANELLGKTRVGYGKLGRSFPLSLDRASSVGGDVEVIRLLNKLAERHEVHLVGRNQCDAVIPNVVNHWTKDAAYGKIKIVADGQRYPDDPAYVWFLEELDRAVDQLPPLDAYVMWLGQHGTCSSFIPSVGEDKKEVDGRVPRGTTRPLMSLINYVYPIVHLLNRRNIRPIWLCPDPRNKLKARDLAQPSQRAVLAQYDCARDNLFYDPSGPQTRAGTVRYTYAGIELLALDTLSLPDSPDPASREHAPDVPLGILVNEGYTNLGSRGRLELLKSWFGGLEYEVFGHWSIASQRDLGRVISTVPVTDVTKTLRRWRATMTFPATNTGWATAKPWECFAAGVVCFRHPKYDDQGHIYGSHMDVDLRTFLSPRTKAELADRVKTLAREDDYWRRVVSQQWDYLRQSAAQLAGGAQQVEDAIYVMSTEGPR